MTYAVRRSRRSIRRNNQKRFSTAHVQARAVTCAAVIAILFQVDDCGFLCRRHTIMLVLSLRRIHWSQVRPPRITNRMPSWEGSGLLVLQALVSHIHFTRSLQKTSLYLSVAMLKGAPLPSDIIHALEQATKRIPWSLFLREHNLVIVGAVLGYLINTHIFRPSQ